MLGTRVGFVTMRHFAVALSPSFPLYFQQMPVTRRSRTQRATSSRGRGRPPTAQQASSEVPLAISVAPTTPITTPPMRTPCPPLAVSTTSLSTATIQQIASAVSQAVLMTIGSAATPAPEQSTQCAPAMLHDVPMVGMSNIDGVDATVQGPLASALQNVSGENLLQVPQVQCTGPFNFNSMSLPIDAQVSAKLKAKIWANEFVDFGLLLSTTPGDARYNISVMANAGSAAPTLCLQPTQKAKSISSIEMWTSAFQIFVGIYTSKYPMDAPSLMKYGEVVRDLAARGGDWYFYDTNFRHMRQQHFDNMPWGTTHWELWIRSQQFGVHNPKSHAPRSVQYSSTGTAPFVPKGYCRKFHKGVECLGCSFKHQCHKCGVTHPSSKCNFRPQRQPSSTQPRGARSRSANTNNNQ